MSAGPKTYNELSGCDKAAALLVCLPEEHSAEVVRRLRDSHVERITTRLLRQEQLTSEVQNALLQEALELTTAEQYISAGGVDYARTLLAKALGEERAEELISRLLAKMEAQPFQYLDGIEAPQVAMFLHNQHPQIIALILSRLGVNQAAAILSLLPERVRPQVSLRLADMDSISPSVVSAIENAFKKKLSSVLDAESTRSKSGGIGFLVRTLRQVDRSTEHAIISDLEQNAPDLAEEIKKLMFVFENLTMLDDRSMQRVLREVDSRDLALAMRSVSDAVRTKVFNNMSARAASAIKEEIDNSPPVRMRTIEEAQQRIVETVRRLEEAEEIVVARGEDDALL